MNLDDALLEARIKIGEVNRRRAEQLARSVLPVFAEDRQVQPARLSSCVLVAVDGHHFAFTAAHVLKEAGESLLWIGAVPNRKLRRKPVGESGRRVGNPYIGRRAGGRPAAVVCDASSVARHLHASEESTLAEPGVCGAGASKPPEFRARDDRSGLIDQHAVLGRAEDSCGSAAESLDALDDRGRIASEHAAIGVERVRHQCRAAHIQQVSRGIRGIRGFGLDELCDVRRIEGVEIPPAARNTGGQDPEHEVASVGQEGWPGMQPFGRRRAGSRRPAGWSRK